MKSLIAAALMTLCAAAFAAPSQPESMTQLMSAAGTQTLPPAVPTPRARPVTPPQPQQIEGTVACAMDIKYKEIVTQIVFVRLFKEMRGTAVLRCADKVVNLTFFGNGPSLGLGLPNRSPFHYVGDTIAGTLQLRLPAGFQPHQLAGTYVNIGGELLGGGVSFSPWVNTDNSLNTTLYLPTSFNPSAAINLTTLEFRLAKK